MSGGRIRDLMGSVSRSLHIGEVKAYFYARRWPILIRTFIFSFILAVLWPYITIVIPAGQVGVVYQPLLGGTSLNRPLREGIRFILPWNKVTLYNLRLKVRKTEFEAVTADGLHIQLGIIYRYRAHVSTAGRLHKAIGPNYPKILLDPAISAVVRAKAALYSADAVYGQDRSALQDAIYAGVIDPANHNLIEGGSDPDSNDTIMISPTVESSVRAGYNKGYMPLIEIVDILITEVRLPQLVRDAVERKQEQQQLQQEYEFRIEREKQESIRKRIEAEGVRDFQRIIQSGISDNYLKWRGIEATLRLATSPNSKTVIIGGGKTGMPLILNTEDGNSRPAPAPVRSKKGAATRSTAQSDSFDLSSTEGEAGIQSGDPLPSPNNPNSNQTKKSPKK